MKTLSVQQWQLKSAHNVDSGAFFQLLMFQFCSPCPLSNQHSTVTTQDAQAMDVSKELLSGRLLLTNVSPEYRGRCRILIHRTKSP
jgi:hypothetical protein